MADTQTEPETMSLNELLDQLADVTDDHLTAGRTAIQTRKAELKAKAQTPEGLTEEERAEAKGLAESWTKLDTEGEKRTAARAETDAALDGIPDAEAPAAEATEQGEPAADPTGTEQAPAEAAPAMAAAAVPRLRLGEIGKGQPPARTTSQGPATTITAAAGGRPNPDGAEMTAAELYEAIDTARRSSWGGDGQVVVASIYAPQNPARHLSAQASGWANAAKADTAAQPLVAAGGIAAPFTVDYSIDVLGVTDRPVKAALPQTTADRAGVWVRRDIDANGAGPVSASGTWTLANDADADNATPKPIWEVPVNAAIQAEVEAVTLGLKFSNISSRFDPEATAANTRAAMIAHAKYADSKLLAKLYAACTATFTHPVTLGAARDVLVMLDKTQAYYRDVHRLGGTVRLRTILPLWIRDLIRADMTRAMHTSNMEWLSMTNGAIDQWFENRNINVSWTLDGRAAIAASGSGNTAVPVMGAQAYAGLTGTNVVPGFADQVEFPLFAEGTFVFLDGGQLDVGIVRDQALVQKNRYIQFQETFEGLYRKGIEAIRCVASVQPIGGSAGTISTASLTD
jgi:hypothetical protein